MNIKISILILICLMWSLLANCGGGGGDQPTESESRPLATITAEGTAQLGPLVNATVSAYRWDNGTRGSLTGSTRTNDLGAYVLTFEDQTPGYLLLESNGGNYQEEATGRTLEMGSDPIQALVYYAADGNTLNAQLTYFTHIAACYAEHLIAEGSDVAGAVTQANQHISNFVGIDIISTRPLDITQELTVNETTEKLTYSLILAGISQALETLRINNNAATDSIFYTSKYLLQLACADIAADGALDGVGALTGANPSGELALDSTNIDESFYRQDIGIGILNFANNSRNKSGYTINDVVELANALSNQSGSLFNNQPGSNADTQGPTISRAENAPTRFSDWADIGFNLTDETGVASVVFQIEGVEVTSTSPSQRRLLFDTKSYADGDYQIRVIATDLLGNTATPAVFDVTFDNTRPVITLTSETRVASQTYLAAGQVSSSGQAFADISLIVNGVEANINPITGVWSADLSLTEGLNDITATATDSVGDVGTLNTQVGVDLTSPILTVATTQIKLANPSGESFSDCTSTQLDQIDFATQTPIFCLGTHKSTLAAGTQVTDTLASQDFLLLGLSVTDNETNNNDVFSTPEAMTLEYRYYQSGETAPDTWTPLIQNPTSESPFFYIPITEGFLREAFYIPADTNKIHYMQIRASDEVGNSAQQTFPFKLDVFVTPELSATVEPDNSYLFATAFDFNQPDTLSNKTYVVKYDIEAISEDYEMGIETINNHGLTHDIRLLRRVHRAKSYLASIWQTRTYLGTTNHEDPANVANWSEFSDINQVVAVSNGGISKTFSPSPPRNEQSVQVYSDEPTRVLTDPWVNANVLAYQPESGYPIPNFLNADCVGNPGDEITSFNISGAYLAKMLVNADDSCTFLESVFYMRRGTAVVYESEPGYPRDETTFEFSQNPHFPTSNNNIVTVLDTDTSIALTPKANGRYEVTAGTPVTIYKHIQLPTLNLYTGGVSENPYVNGFAEDVRLAYELDPRINIIRYETRSNPLSSSLSLGGAVISYELVPQAITP